MTNTLRIKMHNKNSNRNKNSFNITKNKSKIIIPLLKVIVLQGIKFSKNNHHKKQSQINYLIKNFPRIYLID